MTETGATAGRGVRGHGRSGSPLLRAAVRLCGCASCLVAACHRGAPAQAAGSTENDVPVVINSSPPFQYPLDAWTEGTEGEVRLRLYVDSAGRVQPDSTRVASGSGTPALDSAAVRGATLLQFAPAHHDGQAVGMAFYQPVVFRHTVEPSGQPTP